MMKHLTQFIKEYNQITESKNSIEEQYPNVKELGIGEFEGILWGNCFLYNENKYYSEIGWRNCFPSYCKMVINETEAFPHQVDEYQRPDLKKLYD